MVTNEATKKVKDDDEDGDEDGEEDDDEDSDDDMDGDDVEESDELLILYFVSSSGSRFTKHCFLVDLSLR